MARYLTIGWDLEPYTGTTQFLSDVPPSHAYFEYATALYLRGLMVISDWAVPYVAQAYVSGLFKGDAAGGGEPRAARDG